ncbi:NADase-type glycan-binding domain-containing protein [Persicobacter psychrovividus]|uniref:Hint domain-containing protein n=1 Tax=Persicobacter psychrovividus TaxID=387638 RepID=A0ABN6LE20_9BACT|nr:hypothetical protein PEPS_18570 [Persicobacter psychrovividus]
MERQGMPWRIFVLKKPISEMMKQFSIVAFIFLSISALSQEIQELSPLEISPIELNEEGEKEYALKEKIYKRITEGLVKGEKFENFSEAEQYVVRNYEEARDGYWDVLAGCSWYCGAQGPKKITGSSFLKSQSEINYEPSNAHDLNYKNAWVEGVDGYGVGEYLEYTFDATSPRINKIIVVNGYVKSEMAWENNSRVKKLKVYLDDEPYAILNLQDVRGEQTFAVDPIGNSGREDWGALEKKPDWKLKFEIMEVYKGLKYDDVAISEIYFDGLDVHCFAKGTKIQITEHSTKNIEALKVGDLVQYMDSEERKLKSAKVLQLEKVRHCGLVTYQFESGLTVTATKDHPFKVRGKGWASLNPYQSKQYKGFEYIDQIAVGDEFISSYGTQKLVKIQYLEGQQETYTISKLSDGDNFIANGLIVGVEELDHSGLSTK